MDAKQYLKKSLVPIAGEGADTVVEYLSTFDKTKQSDMILFLEENFGHHDSFVEIVSTYCAMFGGPVSEHTYPNLDKGAPRKKVALNYPPIQVAKKKGHAAKGKDKQASSQIVRQNKSKSASPSATRKMCGCFATHHDYATSCLTCGRIHCTTEGNGPCLFCGTDLIAPCSIGNLQSSMPETTINGDTSAAYHQKVLPLSSLPPPHPIIY